MRGEAASPAPTAASRLAAYAESLSYDDLPTAVVERIKATIADTMIACLAGAQEPAGRALADHLRPAPAGGAALLDGSGRFVDVATATLANGVFAHAAEADSLRYPGAGVHPGATIVPAALALAQERGCSGRAFVEAVAAGVEVMFRIGRATHHTCEKRGFHAPGVTGPFGAAVAAAKIMGLDADGIGQAIALAGSFAGGLLAFATSSEETTVKPLHIGRAAESGVLAGRLAASGMRGPSTVLDGRFGLLDVYCTESEPALLTDCLGERFESLAICFKRYPCHISAHAPVEGVLALRHRHGLEVQAVSRIGLTVSEKTASLNAIPAPTNVGLARYSVSFCAAVALTDDPEDPMAYARRLHDPQALGLTGRVRIEARPDDASVDPWSCAVTLDLRDGRRLAIDVPVFPGTPAMPFEWADFERKLRKLVPDGLRNPALSAMQRLFHVDREETLSSLSIGPPERKGRAAEP